MSTQAALGPGIGPGQDTHELCASTPPTPEPSPSRTLRWCRDGHTWIDHLDGTVTPSYAYGATRIDVADPRACPEPRPTGARARHTCARCGTILRSELDLAISRCPRAVAVPCVISREHACAQPADGDGHRWSQRNWPFPGEDDWRLWWVARDGEPPRLLWLIRAVSVRWRNTFDTLDLHIRERVDIDGSDQSVAWTIDRARHDDLPVTLREQWPTRDNGKPLPARFAHAAALPDLRWLSRRIDGTRAQTQLVLPLP